jgi:2-polyprenyl-3-methyl-5-hydroxy-6-metoxy-1,4-benzoquinol methylase
LDIGKIRKGAIMETTTVDLEQAFWNDWNSSHRETGQGDVSHDQAAVIRAWFEKSGRKDYDILDVGCGSGWLCGQLTPFGRVTGTDLADEVLDRARARAPLVRYVAGDFMDLDLGQFDVVVSLEVLSHVADQPAFLAKIASHLRPGGLLMMATQNRPVLQNYNRIPPPAPGHHRRWVDAAELRALLGPKFEVRELFSISPKATVKPWRYVHSRTFKRLSRPFVGDRLVRYFEQQGFGWTLMALAEKKDCL